MNKNVDKHSSEIYYRLQPTLFVINATSLAKPHAIDHLRADILNKSVAVIIVVETWFKQIYMDNSFSIPGFVLHRRDRQWGVGGGIAIYVDQALSNQCFVPKFKFNRNIELLWVSITFQNSLFYIGGIYHPPTSKYYTDDEIQAAISKSLDEINSLQADLTVILAGDFNQMSDSILLSLGLHSAFSGATHQGHNLDRIYASEPIYKYCMAIKSTIKQNIWRYLQGYLKKRFS